MSKIGKYLIEEYRLIIPFILTVINAQNLEIHLRSVYANTSFIRSPYFLTLMISLDMLIATAYIFLTLWNCIKIETSSHFKINQDIVKYYKTNNGDLPDYKIICFDSLMNIERNVEKKSEIWILTENLKDDVSHPIISKIVEDNIKKGVLYTYFLVNPKSKSDETLLFQKGVLEDKYKKYINKNIKFVIIDDETLVIPETYIILYNATSNIKRDGYLAIEIGNNTESFSYQAIETFKLHSIYNFLRNKKELNNKTILPFYKKDKLKWDHSININIIIIIFDIFYLFFTVIFLNVIAISKISSLESLFHIMFPTLILTFFASISIYIIDKVIKFNHNNIANILEYNKIYNSLFEGRESVAKELESIYLSKKNETENKMKLWHLEKIYSCIKTYRKVYILTSISNEILSVAFKHWIKNLIQNNKNVQIAFLIPDNTTTLGKLEYMEELLQTNRNNIVVKQIAEKNLFSINSFDIYFLVGDSINNSYAYIVLGTDDLPIFRMIDESYVDERFRSQVLGRIKKVFNIFSQNTGE